MLVSHTILFLGWLLFYTIHSLISGDSLRKKIGMNRRAYRLIYNAVAFITFGFVVLYSLSIETALLYRPNQLTYYLGLTLATFGILVIKRVFRAYNILELLGLKEENQSTKKLKTSGIHGYMRHPIYSGTLLIYAGYALFNPTLASTISLLSLIVYLPLGIRSEEKKLIAFFGTTYLDYKSKTPSILPSFSKKKMP